jgi:hypothetical protein
VIKLHCQHRDEGGTRCNKCVATVQNGVLVVPFRHHDETHTLALTLADVERLLREDKQRRDPALNSRQTT